MGHNFDFDYNALLHKRLDKDISRQSQLLQLESTSQYIRCGRVYQQVIHLPCSIGCVVLKRSQDTLMPRKSGIATASKSSSMILNLDAN